MVGGTDKKFTYTTTKPTTLNPSDSPPAGTMGYNDIASGNPLTQFIKQGAAPLVLNTKNPSWRGSTTVGQGALIIGDKDIADLI